ncbi:hypothetical protein [Planctobacterium marinum]|uniref:ComF family protein n=1 Tax=Planctobacterium marinum TaxID=1631968 RepID=UPI0030C76A80
MLGSLKRLMARTNQCYCCLQSATTAICSLCAEQIKHFPASEHSFFLNNQRFFTQHLQTLSPYNTLSIGPHAGLLQSLINDFKYKKKTLLRNSLAKLLEEKVLACYSEDELPQILLPVPISPLKRMRRGYNQTELICSQLTRRLSLETSNYLISREIFHTPQASLSGSERRKLAASRFRIEQPGLLENTSHIALFDDVITTGTTLLCIVEQIKKVNPDLRIDLWSLSISLQHQ